MKHQRGANSVYSKNWKDRSEAKFVYSTNSKDRSAANSVFFTNWKDRSEVCLFHKFERWKRSNSAYSRNRQDRSKKKKLDGSKTNRGSIFQTFTEPRNPFQRIDSASLCPGGHEQRPYSSLVSGPLRLFSSSSKVLVFLNNL